MASTGGDGTDDAPLSAVTAPANVLLLAPSMGRGQDVCPTVGTAPAGGSNLLVVLLNGPIGDRLDRWRRHEGLPDRVRVVCCEETRGATTTDDGTTVTTVADVPIPVRTVHSPASLTDLGLAIEGCLDDWTTDGARVDVCFDSLTTLLHYVDVKRAFRFLHTLAPGIRRTDGLAHFHMDPNAHDERTLAIVGSLVDATYRYDEAADEWRIA